MLIKPFSNHILVGPLNGGIVMLKEPYHQDGYNHNMKAMTQNDFLSLASSLSSKGMSGPKPCQENVPHTIMSHQNPLLEPCTQVIDFYLACFTCMPWNLQGWLIWPYEIFPLSDHKTLYEVPENRFWMILVALDDSGFQGHLFCLTIYGHHGWGLCTLDHSSLYLIFFLHLPYQLHWLLFPLSACQLCLNHHPFLEVTKISLLSQNNE